MKEKMNNKKVMCVTIILFVLSFAIFGYSMYLKKSLIIDKESYYASVIMAENPGFDLNSTAFTFGQVSNGTTSDRSVVVSNNYGIPIIVEIDVKGEIADIIGYTPVNIIQINETKEIKLTAYGSDDLEFGKYKGKVIVTIKKDI